MPLMTIKLANYRNNADLINTHITLPRFQCYQVKQDSAQNHFR